MSAAFGGLRSQAQRRDTRASAQCCGRKSLAAVQSWGFARTQRSRRRRIGRTSGFLVGRVAQITARTRARSSCCSAGSSARLSGSQGAPESASLIPRNVLAKRSSCVDPVSASGYSREASRGSSAKCVSELHRRLRQTCPARSADLAMIAARLSALQHDSSGVGLACHWRSAPCHRCAALEGPRMHWPGCCSGSCHVRETRRASGPASGHASKNCVRSCAHAYTRIVRKGLLSAERAARAASRCVACTCVWNCFYVFVV